jgi:hypothetical protein
MITAASKSLSCGPRGLRQPVMQTAARVAIAGKNGLGNGRDEEDCVLTEIVS